MKYTENVNPFKRTIEGVLEKITSKNKKTLTRIQVISMEYIDKI